MLRCPTDKGKCTYNQSRARSDINRGRKRRTGIHSDVTSGLCGEPAASADDCESKVPADDCSLKGMCSLLVYDFTNSYCKFGESLLA